MKKMKELFKDLGVEIKSEFLEEAYKKADKLMYSDKEQKKHD